MIVHVIESSLAEVCCPVRGNVLRLNSKLVDLFFMLEKTYQFYNCCPIECVLLGYLLHVFGKYLCKQLEDLQLGKIARPRAHGPKQLAKCGCVDVPEGTLKVKRKVFLTNSLLSFEQRRLVFGGRYELWDRGGRFDCSNRLEIVMRE